jgi:hypothetical protein
MFGRAEPHLKNRGFSLDHRSTPSSASEAPSLVVIWMLMSPVPVHDGSACHKGSRQKYRAYESMYSAHMDNPPERNSKIPDFEITVDRTMCFAQVK